MKYYTFIISFIFILTAPLAHASSQNIYSFNLKTAKGKELSLGEMKGKSVLLVNIATRCGYTKQLDGLEKLYQKHKSQGLVIIGIPSNDYGSQTPEANKEVAKFCKLNYGITFPVTSKMVVSGKDKSTLMKHVIKAAGGAEIKWNFEKFLFNKKGQFVKKFSSQVKPLGQEIENNLKEVL